MISRLKGLSRLQGAGLVALAAIVVIAIVASQSSDAAPDGFARGNGRIEAERIDVSTKFAGRIQEILVDEGDFVSEGQVMARLDDTEIKAQLREAEAALRQAEQGKTQAEAMRDQRASERDYAQEAYDRAERLLTREVGSEETADQRRSQLRVAEAAVLAAEAEIGGAEAAIEAARARVARLYSNLDDYELTAPSDGRVQYKLVAEGEVLGSGARVLTLLDLADVYMTVFLPTDQAGRLVMGDEARIILDAAPGYVVPARVTFVASEAQFTPKYVETAEEREKLMFRVKVQIPAELLRAHQRIVKTGVPGVAYLRVEAGADWPDDLAVRLPDPAAES